MSKNYYTFNGTVFLEKIINYGILPTIRYNICKMLYPDEMEETYFDEFYQQEFPIAFKRFVLSDISNEPDSAMKNRSKITKVNNFNLPFTAYAIGDLEEDLTNVNNNTKSYNYTIRELGAKVGVRGLKFEVPMISFFATSHDYYYAISKLFDLNMSLTRYKAPIQINGDVVYYPFDFGLEVSKGQYADAFEEQLRVGRIQDIVHGGTVSFYDFSFLDPSSDAGKVYPVDNILYSLRRYYDATNLDQNSLISSITIDNLELEISTNIEEGAEDTTIDTNPIFTFSKRMNTITFWENIVTVPKLFFTERWDDDEKELTLELYQPMNSGTAYLISISKDVKTYEGREMQTDFELNFKTV